MYIKYNPRGAVTRTQKRSGIPIVVNNCNMKPAVKNETKFRIEVIIASKFSKIVEYHGIGSPVPFMGAINSFVVVVVFNPVKLEPKGKAVKGDLKELVGSSSWYIPVTTPRKAFIIKSKA